MGEEVRHRVYVLTDRKTERSRGWVEVYVGDKHVTIEDREEGAALCVGDLTIPLETWVILDGAPIDGVRVENIVIRPKPEHWVWQTALNHSMT